MLPRFSVGRRHYLAIALLAFAIGVLATAARTIKQYQTPGPFDPSRQGMCDFHNGIYFPTRALIRGQSPYGREYAASEPVARQIPFFLPSILAVHIPVALLPLRTAEVVYFVFSVAVVLVIAWVAVSSVAVSSVAVPGVKQPDDGDDGLPSDAARSPIRLDAVFGVAAAIVFSRGGHITLFDGYFTLELVLATFLAIRWGDRRPMGAALALVIVASKPTYLLPLGFLMLSRGHVRALVLGAMMTIVAAGIPFAWLAQHEGNGDLVAGGQTLIAQITEAQEIHRAQDDESPVFSWTRIDLLATVAKWTGDAPSELAHVIVMGALLVPSMLILNRRRRSGVDDGLAGITGALILVTTLVSVYHQSYDALLLVAPLVGVLASVLPGASAGRPRTWTSWSPAIRWSIVVLMAIPLFNYLSTRMFLGRLRGLGEGGADGGELVERVLTSVNGVSLTAALVVLVWMTIRDRPQRCEDAVSPELGS